MWYPLAMARCGGCGRSLGEEFGSCPSCGGTVIPSRVERGLQPLFEPGQVLGGRFRVEKVLGTGASGVVYGVVDELRKDRVALKVLWEQAQENEAAFERLRREIRASQKAPHPNLVAIHDLLMVEGRPALVMAWVEGETLRERVRREGALPWGEAVAIGAALLHALAHLHGLAIVHRDVKSGNVLLGSDGGVKLGDFGLVKGEDLGMSLTLTGASLGTPGYMAPEVIRGKEATPSSDLYSLGVVLFEMLAGRAPFSGGSSLEVVSRQLSEPPPLALLKEGRVPRWLIRFTGRLLERTPADRLPSAKAALGAMEARRGFSLTHRRRRLIAAAAMVAALGVATGWGVSWWRFQALPSLEIGGSTLVARDVFGRTLFRRTFDMPVQSACAGRFGPDGSTAVACVLTWDGIEGGLDPADGGERGGNRLLFLDPAGRTLAMTRLAMGANRSLYAPRFKADLSTHRFRAGGSERLVVYYHHVLWYPAALIVFQPLTSGAGEGRYAAPDCTTFYSSGHLGQPFLYRDLDGDGMDEVVFTGVNNLLYRGYFAGAIKVDRASRRGLLGVSSPDMAPVLAARPLLYRLASFDHPFPRLAWRADPPGLQLQDGEVPFLNLSPLGERTDTGSATLAQVESLNGWISDMCRMRQLEDWGGMLSALRSGGRPFPQPYGWLRRFFTAHALMGLGRYDDALEELSSGPALAEGTLPFEAYRMRLEGLFLAGRYRECLASFTEMRDVARKGWADLGVPALWAAVYADDGGLTRALETGHGANSYPVPEAPALLAALRGDYRLAEALARDQRPETSVFPEPALVLIHCLVMEGRLKEARAVLDILDRRFPGEEMDAGETELWLLWHEKPGDRALVGSMDRLLDQKRLKAAVDMNVRVLLPLTVARAACMHREIGDVGEARRLQEEAYRIAPKSWRPGLLLK